MRDGMETFWEFFYTSKNQFLRNSCHKNDSTPGSWQEISEGILHKLRVYEVKFTAECEFSHK